MLLYKGMPMHSQSVDRSLRNQVNLGNPGNLANQVNPVNLGKQVNRGRKQRLRKEINRNLKARHPKLLLLQMETFNRINGWRWRSNFVMQGKHRINLYGKREVDRVRR